MKCAYEDIRKRIKEEPKWFDESGVPRYDKFSPDMISNIYADEVALVEIECQWCGKKFLVEVTWDILDKLRDVPPLSKRVKKGEIYYGDPPIHKCTGDTMTSDFVRVIEFWQRNGYGDWKRNRRLETKNKKKLKTK